MLLRSLSITFPSFFALDNQSLVLKKSVLANLLDRTLRYLNASGLVKEVSEGTYKASHVTTSLTQPGFNASLKHQ